MKFHLTIDIEGYVHDVGRIATIAEFTGSLDYIETTNDEDLFSALDLIVDRLGDYIHEKAKDNEVDEIWAKLPFRLDRLSAIIMANIPGNVDDK